MDLPDKTGTAVPVLSGGFRTEVLLCKSVGGPLLNYKFIYGGLDMSSSSNAMQRILSLLDDNSFVEIGAKVTARATDFNLKPDSPVMESLTETSSMYTARTLQCWAVP